MKLDRQEYPFTSHFFSINNHYMHYIDEGKGNVILFIHGTPSWSFDFRNQIKELSKTYHCIAIDHIGFGLSEKPKNYNYSTSNHALTTEQFILSKKLNNITMVVHDFGGPIGLSFAVKYPHLIKNLVVLNSWSWSVEDDPAFKKLKRILKSPILPFLYRRFNFSARYLLPASFGEKKLSKKLKKQYSGVLATKNEREGTLAFARSLLNDQEWFEKIWDEITVLKEKPTLFLWGMKDQFISPLCLKKFETAFINHTTIKLVGCGHFPQEEESKAVTEAMAEFLNQNLR